LIFYFYTIKSIQLERLETMQKSIFLFFFSFIFSFIGAQSAASLSLKERFRLHANEAIDEIIIDGQVKEKTWAAAEIGTNFWQKLPYFAEHADPKTEVRIAYDNRFLYVSAICFQEGETIIQSLKRDLFWDNDGIAIGSYIPELTEKAKKTGTHIGKVQVNVGNTACKVPFSPAYIEKVEKRGSVGKKRKTARC